MFGFNEEQFAWFGLTIGVGAFMLYMLFIIGQLAWESKAGKFGTFVIFLGLASLVKVVIFGETPPKQTRPQA